MGMRSLIQLGQYVADKYQRDDCNSLAAALAYFALFSFFPLILVVISLVGFVVDPTTAQVQDQILRLVGSDEVRDLIVQTLEHFNQNRVSAGLIGFATLFMAASGIFGALDRAFDVIWETRPIPERTLRATVLLMAGKRLLAFALVLGCAVLILISLLGNLVISLVVGLTDWLPRQDLLVRVAQLLITLLLLTVGLGTIFKLMPDQPVTWGDVLPAALITAVAFAALQAVVSVIFGLINFASYGAVGGVMTLMLWIFLSAQVVLIGGEISHAWAKIYGSGSAGRRARKRSA